MVRGLKEVSAKGEIVKEALREKSLQGRGGKGTRGEAASKDKTREGGETEEREREKERSGQRE